MVSGNRDELCRLDKAHVWHPFTQMQDWIQSEEDPLIIHSGRGATLIDIEGNEYLDGNSSIWTNIHGHGHPKIVTAIREQAELLAHCSALGYSNEPAIRLASRLVDLLPGKALPRVFFTDDGSTAIECACRMAIQYRQLREENGRTTFLSFAGAYHGDTTGAASLGGIGVFHDRFASMGFERMRADSIEDLESIDSSRVNAAVIEPLIQGANRMHTWPKGMLSRLRDWCSRNGILLILDEVMTGFGRTGTLFACEQEGVVPDFLCLAKGLTGGTLPLAATLTSEQVFEAFLGTYAEQKTFFYGHSYSGNPLGCAAALANLAIFEEEKVLESLPEKIRHFQSCLAENLGSHERVGEIRQCGMIAGVDLTDCDWREQTGARVCKVTKKHGLLTRPIGDTLTLLPPLCSTHEEIERMTVALRNGMEEVLK